MLLGDSEVGSDRHAFVDRALGHIHGVLNNTLLGYG